MLYCVGFSFASMFISALAVHAFLARRYILAIILVYEEVMRVVVTIYQWIIIQANVKFLPRHSQQMTY